MHAVEVIGVVRAHSCRSDAQLVASNKLTIDNLKPKAALHPLAAQSASHDAHDGAPAHGAGWGQYGIHLRSRAAVREGYLRSAPHFSCICTRRDHHRPTVVPRGGTLCAKGVSAPANRCDASEAAGLCGARGRGQRGDVKRQLNHCTPVRGALARLDAHHHSFVCVLIHYAAVAILLSLVADAHLQRNDDRVVSRSLALHERR